VIDHGDFFWIEPLKIPGRSGTFSAISDASGAWMVVSAKPARRLGPRTSGPALAKKLSLF
jgi:hypothetical protein